MKYTAALMALALAGNTVALPWTKGLPTDATIDKREAWLKGAPTDAVDKREAWLKGMYVYSWL